MEKIFDVLPPKTFKKIEKKETIPLPKKKGLKIGWILFFLIILGLAIFFLKDFSFARIEIWPKTEISKFTMDLLIDKTIDNPDFSKKIIPGQYLELENTISREFPSSGKKLKEQNATGKIKVFNETTQPQVLVATTRFISKEGKLFRSVNRVTAPAGFYEGGKFLPGEVEVEVKAAESGEDYNIEPSTFSIPGLAGSPSYTKIYGKSSQAMTGGFKKEVLVVTDEDLKQAKEFLSEKIREEGEKSLKGSIPAGFSSIEGVSKTEIIDTIFSVKVGDEVEKFNCQMKIKSKTLIFFEKELDNFVKDFIVSKIPGKEIKPESLKINYSVQNFNIDSGKVFLLIDAEGKTYPKVQTSSLKKDLANKLLEDAKIFLKNQPEIDRFKINIFPFWAKFLPENLERIRFTIKLD